MEKTDSEKQPPQETPAYPPPPPSEPQCSSSSEMISPGQQSNNPLYCSYVDGQFTYKDPNTGCQYVWNENEKKWVVNERGEEGIDSNKLAEGGEAGGKEESEGGGDEERKNEIVSPGTSQVQFDGENYTYTDQDGTVFVWDSGKGAWFPKVREEIFFLNFYYCIKLCC